MHEFRSDVAYSSPAVRTALKEFSQLYEEHRREVGRMIDVTDANFRIEVESATVPVVVEFGGSWCAPCKEMQKNLETLSVKYKRRVKFCHIDISSAPEISNRLSIMSLPTTVIFNKGKTCAAICGLQTSEKIEKVLADMGFHKDM